MSLFHLDIRNLISANEFQSDFFSVYESRIAQTMQNS